MSCNLVGNHVSFVVISPSKTLQKDAYRSHNKGVGGKSLTAIQLFSCFDLWGDYLVVGDYTEKLLR